jgi:hypothetical protein
MRRQLAALAIAEFLPERRERTDGARGAGRIAIDTKQPIVFDVGAHGAGKYRDLALRVRLHQATLSL